MDGSSASSSAVLTSAAAAKISNLEKNLHVEEVGRDQYRGWQYWRPFNVSHTFGGHAVAQALAAACQTLEGEHRGKWINSVHAYFVRPGDLEVPIEYRVDRLHDGRGYSRRSVTATQGDVVIFTCIASFQHRTASVIHHQLECPPDAPATQDLLTQEEVAEKFFKTAPENVRTKYVNRSFPEEELDFRDGKFPVEPSAQKLQPEGSQYLWLRLKNTLSSSEQTLHQCALAYETDFGLGRTALRRHFDMVSASDWTSLDHSIWFHAPVRANEWVLHVMESPSASCGRALNFGRIYSQSGELLASTAQESAYRNISKL